MVMMEWSWIHGSTVMDVEPSNQPPNHFTCQILTYADFTTAFGSQPRPYDQNVVKSRVGWRAYHAAQRPTFTKLTHFWIACTLAQVENVVRPFVAVQGRLHLRVEKDDHAYR
jgi:hypothetical protein